jgi:hypothetical protein
MQTGTSSRKVLKRALLAMLLAGATVAGSVVVPTLQGHGVPVTYASDCEAGGIPRPDLDCPEPTPTPTPDPGH